MTISVKKYRWAILFAFVFCVAVCWAQNNRVYYYERVKTVRNGQQRPSSGDGHYLAINSNGLYECDRNGSSMSKGFVKYENSNNNRPYYSGKAFLGPNLGYVFNSDYSRLNLHMGDGTIHVYERRQSPSSPSAQRSYNSDMPVPGPAPDPRPDPTHDPTPGHTPAKYMVCPHCKGTKRLLKTGTGYISKNQYWVTCPECGQRHLNTTTHRHVDCYYCHGTGKIRIN